MHNARRKITNFTTSTIWTSQGLQLAALKLRVLLLIQTRNNWKVTAGRQVYITVLECIDGAGGALPPGTTLCTALLRIFIENVMIRMSEEL